MSDNKNDDFWKASPGDDFWNKPVTDDDWFKDDKKSDYSGLSKEFLRDEKPRENPFWENTGTETQIEYQNPSNEFKNENPYLKTHVHQDSGWVMEQHKMEKPASLEKKKRIHIHSIICLIAIFLAIMSAVTAFVFIKLTEKRAAAAANELSYEEVKVDKRFSFNENNDVVLEDYAYTIVTKDSFKGFPEGRKLIAVYAEVESDEYIRDSKALEDIYIGFYEKDDRAYKQPVRYDKVSAYLYGFGFNDEQILRSYGVGNGADYAGYYFFLVPSDVKEITLYMEKKKTEDKIPVIEKIYVKNMTVLPEDEELTNELAQRGGR